MSNDPRTIKLRNNDNSQNETLQISGVTPSGNEAVLEKSWKFMIRSLDFFVIGVNYCETAISWVFFNHRDIHDFNFKSQEELPVK